MSTVLKSSRSSTLYQVCPSGPSLSSLYLDNLRQKRLWFLMIFQACGIQLNVLLTRKISKGLPPPPSSANIMIMTKADCPLSVWYSFGLSRTGPLPLGLGLSAVNYQSTLVYLLRRLGTRTIHCCKFSNHPTQNRKKKLYLCGQ